LQLQEVANFVTGYFRFKIKFPAKRKRELTTKLAISCNCCWQFGFLFIQIFGLVFPPFKVKSKKKKMLKRKIKIIELPIQAEIPVEHRFVSPHCVNHDFSNQKFWGEPTQTSCFFLKKLIRNILKNPFQLIFHKESR